MRSSTGPNLAVVIAILTCGFAMQARAGRAAAIVELFTSQGCSSCPPANANLIQLNRDPTVPALSFSVTHWDHIGWRDNFGNKEFTERQMTYEPALGQSGAFTQQMVINGESIAGYDFSEIRNMIASEPALSGPHIALSTKMPVTRFNPILAYSGP